MILMPCYSRFGRKRFSVFQSANRPSFKKLMDGLDNCSQLSCPIGMNKQNYIKLMSFNFAADFFDVISVELLLRISYPGLEKKAFLIKKIEVCC